MLGVTQQEETEPGLESRYLGSGAPDSEMLLTCPALSYAQCRLGKPRREGVPVSLGCPDAGLSVPGDGRNVGSIWFSHVETGAAAACG